MEKRKLYILVSLLISVCLSAQNQYAGFEKKVHVSTDGDTLRYRILFPENLKKDEKYPLVLFLHGAGESGSDNEKQLTHGGQMWLNPVNRAEHPTFVIAPQCPLDGYWAYMQCPVSLNPTEMPLEVPLSPLFKAVKELLDTYLKRSDVDKSRVYVIGLSMGGMGTFDLAVRYPDVFAAAIPICGTVNPDRLVVAKNVNFRIFHGDADDIVTVEGSRAAYKALKAIGADVEYIEFPGCRHSSWNLAFNYPDFMEWLFCQKKKN